MNRRLQIFLEDGSFIIPIFSFCYTMVAWYDFLLVQGFACTPLAVDSKVVLTLSASYLLYLSVLKNKWSRMSSLADTLQRNKMNLMYGPLDENHVEITAESKGKVLIKRHRQGHKASNIIISDNVLEHPEWLLRELRHE